MNASPAPLASDAGRLGFRVARAIPAAGIAMEWQWLGPLLATAVRHDPSASIEALRDALIAGRAYALAVTYPPVFGILVIEFVKKRRALILWASYFAGKVEAPPKLARASFRELMELLEAGGRAAECTEIRIAGRDWSRMFPDFKPLRGIKNGLRKAL